MAQYGVSTTNVFDLLDDETPRQQQKAAAAPAAKQAKQAANVKPAQSQERTEQRSNRGRGDNQRGGRGASRGGAVRTPRPTGETVTAVDTDASAGGYSEVSGDHEKRSRNTNTRGRGHGGRGRGFGDGSRREFDRRGAPRGRAPHEPRKGGHNLGDQIESQQESNEAAAPAVDGEAVATEVVAEEEPAVEIEAVEFVPEDTSLTYDEFLEQQRARAVADDLADRVRRVEIDESQWKAVKPLVAVPETATETETRVRKEKKSKGKVSLDQFVGSPVGGPPPREQRDYDDNRRGGRGGNRGGRGAFRGEHRGESRGENREHRGENRGGRGGRGGNFQRGGRGGARGGANINVMDESAFPSLGGK